MTNGLACGGIVETKAYTIGEMPSDYIIPKGMVHRFLDPRCPRCAKLRKADGGSSKL